MSRGGVLTVDEQSRDESATDKFVANHRLLIVSLLVGALSALLFYAKTDLPELGNWWGHVLAIALVLFALSWVIDPLLGVWTRWEIVSADAGLRRSRGGVPARWVVYPAGWRSVGLIVSADTIMREDWDKSAPLIAQGFGYERAKVNHSRRRVILTFTNAPLAIDGDCVKQIDLNQQVIHVGIDDKGKDYVLDTAGHSGMVVAGIPGSGKTVFLRRLVKSFALNPANRVVVFDGKGTDDFGDLRAKNVSVLSGTPDTNAKISTQLEHLEQELERRASSGSARGRVVVVVDECQGFVPVKGLTVEEKKPREKSIKALKDFVARGRSLGFFVVLATQKPDSDTLPTVLRDNCGLRACGRVRTVEAEKMVLGESLGRAQSLAVGQMIFDDGTHHFVKVAKEP